MEQNLFVTDKYKNEEVESNCEYLSGYKPNLCEQIDNVIEDFERQVRLLDSLFNQGTEFNKDWIVKMHPICPSWVEKFFAQIPWQSVAPTYAEAVQKVLDAIKTAREGKFSNWREGLIENVRFRQSAKTESVSQKLAESQKDHNVIAMPAQFGIRHRGRSVRRAREVMNANEFGLGAFATGIMILTHPERLQHFRHLYDLWICCAGDEFHHHHSVVPFDCAPHFRFINYGVEFFTYRVNIASARFGSVTGFLPQF